MFHVDETTKKITLHRGDTGSVGYHIGGYDFGTNDRALWTMKNPSGTVVKEGIYEMEDGSFTVDFANADTDQLQPGTYTYDVRVIVGPEYNGSGVIVDGQIVATPESPLIVELLSTVGQI